MSQIQALVPDQAPTPQDARDRLLVALPIPAQRDAVAGWLGSRSAARTAEEYAKDAEVFVRWLARRGPVDLASVTHLDVTMFMASLRDSVSARTGRPLAVRTVRHRVAVVSAMFKYLAKHSVRVGNPASEVDRPKAPSGGETPVRPEEDLSAMWGGTSSMDDVVVGLFYFSLMRCAELVNADVRGLITVKGKRVLRVRTKGSKIRDVALPADILAPLLEYVGDRTDGPVILGADGQRMTRNKVVRLLRRVGAERGVPNPHLINPHMIRASGITHLLDAGVPIQDVQHIAGHDDPATTAAYYKRSHGHARDLEVAEILVARAKAARRPIPAPREDESA